MMRTIGLLLCLAAFSLPLQARGTYQVIDSSPSPGQQCSASSEQLRFVVSSEAGLREGQEWCCVSSQMVPCGKIRVDHVATGSGTDADPWVVMKSDWDTYLAGNSVTVNGIWEVPHGEEITFTTGTDVSCFEGGVIRLPSTVRASDKAAFKFANNSTGIRFLDCKFDPGLPAVRRGRNEMDGITWIQIGDLDTQGTVEFQLVNNDFSLGCRTMGNNCGYCDDSALNTCNELTADVDCPSFPQEECIQGGIQTMQCRIPCDEDADCTGNCILTPDWCTTLNNTGSFSRHIQIYSGTVDSVIRNNSFGYCGFGVTAPEYQAVPVMHENLTIVDNQGIYRWGIEAFNPYNKLGGFEQDTSPVGWTDQYFATSGVDETFRLGVGNNGQNASPPTTFENLVVSRNEFDGGDNIIAVRQWSGDMLQVDNNAIDSNGVDPFFDLRGLYRHCRQDTGGTPCATDANCGGNRCILGTCKQECETDADCVGIGDESCWDARLRTVSLSDNNCTDLWENNSGRCGFAVRRAVDVSIQDNLSTSTYGSGMVILENVERVSASGNHAKMTGTQGQQLGTLNTGGSLYRITNSKDVSIDGGTAYDLLAVVDMVGANEKVSIKNTLFGTTIPPTAFQYIVNISSGATCTNCSAINNKSVVDLVGDWTNDRSQFAFYAGNSAKAGADSFEVLGGVELYNATADAAIVVDAPDTAQEYTLTVPPLAPPVRHELFLETSGAMTSDVENWVFDNTKGNLTFSTSNDAGYENMANANNDDTGTWATGRPTDPASLTGIWEFTSFPALYEIRIGHCLRDTNAQDRCEESTVSASVDYCFGAGCTNWTNIATIPFQSVDDTCTFDDRTLYDRLDEVGPFSGSTPGPLRVRAFMQGSQGATAQKCQHRVGFVQLDDSPALLNSNRGTVNVASSSMGLNNLGVLLTNDDCSNQNTCFIDQSTCFDNIGPDQGIYICESNDWKLNTSEFNRGKTATLIGATPDVAGIASATTSNGSDTKITDFLSGVEGQDIVVTFDTNTSLGCDSANLRCNLGEEWFPVAAEDFAHCFKQSDSTWWCALSNVSAFFSEGYSILGSPIDESKSSKTIGAAPADLILTDIFGTSAAEVGLNNGQATYRVMSNTSRTSSGVTTHASGCTANQPNLTSCTISNPLIPEGNIIWFEVTSTGNTPWEVFVVFEGYIAQDASF